MYKSVFQNSKMALLFVGLTLVSAVSMVGTSEEGGVVTKAVDMVESQRSAFANEAEAFAKERSEGDAPPVQPPVFGEFDNAQTSPPSGLARKPGQGVGGPGGGPMNAPMSPTAIAVKSGGPALTGEPYISDRELTIEPE